MRERPTFYLEFNREQARDLAVELIAAEQAMQSEVQAVLAAFRASHGHEKEPWIERGEVLPLLFAVETAAALDEIKKQP